jgi:hypothetical protein
MSVAALYDFEAGIKTAALSSATFELALNPRTTEAHGKTLAGATSKTLKSGAKITTTAAMRVITVTKSASCTATTAYILSSVGATLATAAFSGNAATFAYDLSTSTSYYLAVDSGGAAYDVVSDTPTFPIAGTYLSWAGGYLDGAASASLCSVASVTVVSPYRAVAGHVLSGVTQQADADFVAQAPILYIGFANGSLSRVGQGANLGEISILIRFMDVINKLTDNTLQGLRSNADKIVQEIESAGSLDVQSREYLPPVIYEDLHKEPTGGTNDNLKYVLAVQDISITSPLYVDP